MNRSHNRLVFLVILAMLTFALANLQAQSSDANSATANTNALTRPISNAQFKKLLADAAKNGDVRAIQPIVIKTLGIEPGQERDDSFQSSDKQYHTFSQFDNGNYLFTKADELIAYVYYVDKNLVLISACSRTRQGLTIIQNKDAQAGLDAELKFFAGTADQL